MGIQRDNRSGLSSARHDVHTRTVQVCSSFMSSYARLGMTNTDSVEQNKIKPYNDTG